jgi:hypothetical protein
MRRICAVLALASVAGACATLGSLGAIVQPPRFEEAPDRQAEIRILPATGSRGLDGISVRLWTKVTNPNPFGFRLSTLAGTLFLEDARAATVEFPLGLPLTARGTDTIPIDISVGFAELPRLGGVIERAISRQPIRYRLDGTIAVEAGRFGTPVFGPMTLIQGRTR